MKVHDWISQYNDEALTADGFDAAIIGVAERCGQPMLVVYDAQKCIEILVERDNMSLNDAKEFFQFNTHIFLLTKSANYYFDIKAVKEPAVQQRWGGHKPSNFNNSKGGVRGLNHDRDMMPPTRIKRTVWKINTFPYYDVHCATFPPDIPKIAIMSGSKIGDIILDPFAGSGTTGMVALELGRKAVLIELNSHYCDLIRQRCDVTPGLKLQ